MVLNQAHALTGISYSHRCHNAMWPHEAWPKCPQPFAISQISAYLAWLLSGLGIQELNSANECADALDDVINHSFNRKYFLFRFCSQYLQKCVGTSNHNSGFPLHIRQSLLAGFISGTRRHMTPEMSTSLCTYMSSSEPQPAHHEPSVHHMKSSDLLKF